MRELTGADKAEITATVKRIAEALGTCRPVIAMNALMIVGRGIADVGYKAALDAAVKVCREYDASVWSHCNASSHAADMVSATLSQAIAALPVPVALEELLGAVARGWCHDKNSSKTMDSDLAVVIAEEVQRLYAQQEPEWYHGIDRHGVNHFYHRTEVRPSGHSNALYTTPPIAAIAACNWTQPAYDDAECNAWQTDCGAYFAITEGKPSENNMKFCHHCGKTLVEHPYVEPEESE